MGVQCLFAPARAADEPTEADVTRQAILYDAAAPTGGNPKGDLNLVVFFDYNCPYCKRSEPDLLRLVKTDGKIRLVYKDWPILTPASIKAAQWALAAKYQGRYDDAHAAMMAIPGSKIPEDQMRRAIVTAGLDMDRLDADLQTHAGDITTLLRRNLAQADSLGLQGTPAYIVGEYRVTSALTYDKFKHVASDARARQAKP
ncbi:DsbA family protein [Bradyrhizobium jicamae]|uniref:DsbA family protein n=2 Tax=Bradyrhizobium jicamae TaxID=280332 RepID=A0ABS5FT31_9BRAD|nr:DsbA family protein [Bradyrhizobium jicamae]